MYGLTLVWLIWLYSKKKILDSFNKHIKKFNVIITTGGASVGEEDHLVNILKEKGKVSFEHKGGFGWPVNYSIGSKEKFREHLRQSYH